MDAKQLISLMLKSGCYSDKKKTRNGLFAEVSYNNFDTDQVYNRLNAGWKTAQYIIVSDCTETNIDNLISQWKTLAFGFTDQYLIVFRKIRNCYMIYNNEGNAIGDDSILKELIEKNRLKGIMQKADAPNETTTLKTGDNLIIYGVPGCGKSYYIKHFYLNGIKENQQERVVFHPDYSYSDFIGQILPESVEDVEGNKHISYCFNPGPFTKILKKSVNDPFNNYYLVIEELNRGNAPSIFGDVFQLLDRVDGVSEYGIDNAEMAACIYGDAQTKVRIPRNLFILATMNTADQNVFTLDTAFKRRWRMKSVVSNFDTCAFGGKHVCGTGVTWKTFAETVNECIVECAESSVGSEDKRLGAYFVSEREIADVEMFSEKVLMYLWNDAFKYDKERIFKVDKYNTLEALLIGFKDERLGVFSVEFSQS